jgi:hypothetical protein
MVVFGFSYFTKDTVVDVVVIVVIIGRQEAGDFMLWF